MTAEPAAPASIPTASLVEPTGDPAGVSRWFEISQGRTAATEGADGVNDGFDRLRLSGLVGRQTDIEHYNTFGAAEGGDKDTTIARLGNGHEGASRLREIQGDAQTSALEIRHGRAPEA